MQIIDGKQIAQKIIDELKSRSRPDKIFAAILVGSAGSPQAAQSEGFLKQKEKVAKELGIDFRIYDFQEPAGGFTNDFLREEVGKIALLKRVGGVIVQLPLPEQINKHYILNVIPREKDVDVLGGRALGAFYVSRNPILPPAVETVKEIIENRKLKIENLRIAVVGAGFLIGKPIVVWLMNQKIKEMTIFEKGSLPAQAGDLSSSSAGGLKNYDLIISGTGVAGLIKPEMLKEGAGIIDFGYNIEMKNEKLEIRGDFDVSKIENFGWYTPTPGGTGPILVAKIFENFYKLNPPLLKDEKTSR
jgi:5,10-methylene-tetrahydrofolate dehydrogenase/methenyl tetrahydrofolate cyclohydrolase